MILSNNPKTYIALAIHHIRYGAGIYHKEYITGIYYNEYGTKIYKKYMHRWAGPSAAHTSTLRSNLRKNSNIKLRSNL